MCAFRPPFVQDSEVFFEITPSCIAANRLLSSPPQDGGSSHAAEIAVLDASPLARLTSPGISSTALHEADRRPWRAARRAGLSVPVRLCQRRQRTDRNRRHSA